MSVLYVYHWLMCLAVCVTRHWQTFGRLVQELNVCTVRVSLINVLGCLCNGALADIRSTGAGTKCLYCTCIIDWCAWLFVLQGTGRHSVDWCRNLMSVLYVYHWSMCLAVCVTRHWQTSGRLVQELNVCTVRVSLIDVLGCLCNWALADIRSTGAGT